ncbi:MAG: BON domain-containing protein [Acidobacteriaceae bacterium]
MAKTMAAVGAAAILLAAAPAAATAQEATAGAAQQSNHMSDLTITRNIRRAVLKDKSLSIEAHNVTIVTKDGKVTLKGPVKSDSEKQTVESAANNIAGPGNVDDQLSVSR